MNSTRLQFIQVLHYNITEEFSLKHHICAMIKLELYLLIINLIFEIFLKKTQAKCMRGETKSR